MTKLETMMITGSRGIIDREFIFKALDCVYSMRNFKVLIHGKADGVDDISDEWAILNKIDTDPHLPKYEIYGRYAPLRRNTDMVIKCDFGVAIHDFVSTGTLDSIKKLIKHNKLYGIFCYLKKDSSINRFIFAKYLSKYGKYILNYDDLSFKSDKYKMSFYRID